MLKYLEKQLFAAILENIIDLLDCFGFLESCFAFVKQFYLTFDDLKRSHVSEIRINL